MSAVSPVLICAVYRQKITAALSHITKPTVVAHTPILPLVQSIAASVGTDDTAAVFNVLRRAFPGPHRIAGWSCEADGRHVVLHRLQ